MKSFNRLARVIVSTLGGWKQAGVGAIVSEPEPIETLKGPECFYWVEFDQAAGRRSFEKSLPVVP
jgi:hypothetical protein